jgi:hypothetical protein
VFTDGNTQQYEALMQEPPNTQPKHGRKAPTTKYKYADLSCDYCIYHKKCKFELCPYIMDCLNELITDKAFIQAVAMSETCENEHKQTLLHLKTNGAIMGVEC